MVNHSHRGIGLLILLILLCGLIMGYLGEPIGNSIKYLAFLKNHITIGMAKPVILDLKIITLTFGISLNVNFMSLVGILIGYFIYRKCR